MFIAPIIFAGGLWAVSVLCLLLALFVSYANHIGGATAPDSVDHRPAVYLVVAAVILAVMGYVIAA